jgi:hypothetical protein
MRFAEKPGQEAGWCSTAGTRVVAELEDMRTGALETQRMLETLGLGRYTPAQRFDESAVTRTQDLAEEELACEARGRASSCSAHHGWLHRTEGQTEGNKQNEQDTDLSRL